MQKLPSKSDVPELETQAEAGELNALLGKIEKEAVPARLLELAMQLQAALVQRRVKKADMNN